MNCHYVQHAGRGVRSFLSFGHVLRYCVLTHILAFIVLSGRYPLVSIVDQSKRLCFLRQLPSIDLSQPLRHMHVYFVRFILVKIMHQLFPLSRRLFRPFRRIWQLLQLFQRIDIQFSYM